MITSLRCLEFVCKCVENSGPQHLRLCIRGSLAGGTERKVAFEGDCGEGKQGHYRCLIVEMTFKPDRANGLSFFVETMNAHLARGIPKVPGAQVSITGFFRQSVIWTFHPVAASRRSASNRQAAFQSKIAHEIYQVPLPRRWPIPTEVTGTQFRKEGATSFRFVSLI